MNDANSASFESAGGGVALRAELAFFGFVLGRRRTFAGAASVTGGGGTFTGAAFTIGGGGTFTTGGGGKPAEPSSGGGGGIPAVPSSGGGGGTLTAAGITCPPCTCMPAGIGGGGGGARRGGTCCW